MLLGRSKSGPLQVSRGPRFILSERGDCGQESRVCGRAYTNTPCRGTDGPRCLQASTLERVCSGVPARALSSKYQYPSFRIVTTGNALSSGPTSPQHRPSPRAPIITSLNYLESLRPGHLRSPTFNFTFIQRSPKKSMLLVLSRTKHLNSQGYVPNSLTYCVYPSKLMISKPAPSWPTFHSFTSSDLLENRTCRVCRVM